MKKRRLLVLLLALLCPAFSAWAAEAPYFTMTEDHNGRMVYSQAGYLPDRAFLEFDGVNLKKPADLFVDAQDRLFISDAGNKRVIACDAEGGLLLLYGKGELEAPGGIFVREQRLYVADSKLEKVLVYNTETGEKVFELCRPDSPLYGIDAAFRPLNVAVDHAGCIYVIGKGNVDGIAQFSATGDFLGYFGANETRLSLLETLQRSILTDEQINQLPKSVPPAPTNLDIDDYGMVYTVTSGIRGVRRLSIGGNDTFPSVHLGFLAAKDVAAGRDETVFVLDQNGYIMEYTRDGRMPFYFGGLDAARSRAGLFVATVALDVDGQGRLYVLDRDKGLVQRFEMTEYAQTVHLALRLYQNGLYEESKEPWEQVLSSNSLFDYAYAGLGQSYFRLEDYSRALSASRLGGDRAGYSDAFWEIRNNWLQHNALYAVAELAILALARHGWKRLRKKGAFPWAAAWRDRLARLRLPQQLAYGRVFLRNPYDGCYGIKKEGRVSGLSATIIYLLVFAFYMIDKYTCGYLFKRVPDGQYEALMDLGLVLGGIGLFLISCHLICSIREGEGTLKQLYCGLACALTPYLMLLPVRYVLSFVLTNNEAFLITLCDTAAVVGVLALVVVMVRYIQDYTFTKTITTLLLTLLTMLMLMIGMVIATAMVAQLYDFIAAVWKEARFYHAQ